MYQIQEQIEDTASRVDVANVHSQQLEKKIKQFDKVIIVIIIIIVVIIRVKLFLFRLFLH